MNELFRLGRSKEFDRGPPGSSGGAPPPEKRLKRELSFSVTDVKAFIFEINILDILLPIIKYPLI